MSKLAFLLLSAAIVLLLWGMGARPEDGGHLTAGIVVALMAIPWLALGVTAFAIPLTDDSAAARYHSGESFAMQFEPGSAASPSIAAAEQLEADSQ